MKLLNFGETWFYSVLEILYYSSERGLEPGLDKLKEGDRVQIYGECVWVETAEDTTGEQISIPYICPLIIQSDSHPDTSWYR